MGRMIQGLGGAFGGLLGTAFMEAGMKLDPQLPEEARAPKLAGDPGDFMVKQAEQLAGTALPKDTHETLAHSLHWAYGIGWGALLGLATQSIGPRTFGQTMLAGAGMGAACWAAGYVGWLPASGLVAPIHRQGMNHAASALASHVVFGMISAVPIYALSRLFAPRRRILGIF